MQDCDNEAVPFLTRIVWFWEAVNWVAYREWNEKSIGPVPLFQIMSDTSDEDMQQIGRVEFAEEILVEAASQGKIRLLGRKCPISHDEEVYDFSPRNTEKEYSIIPKELMAHWQGLEDLTDTFHQSDIIFEGKVAFVDVLAIEEEIITQWPENLKKEEEETSTLRVIKPSQITESHFQPSRGRPPKYNWELFLNHIIQIANTPDGLAYRVSWTVGPF